MWMLWKKAAYKKCLNRSPSSCAIQATSFLINELRTLANIAPSVEWRTSVILYFVLSAVVRRSLETLSFTYRYPKEEICRSKVWGFRGVRNSISSAYPAIRIGDRIDLKFLYYQGLMYRYFVSLILILLVC